MICPSRADISSATRPLSQWPRLGSWDASPFGPPLMRLKNAACSSSASDIALDALDGKRDSSVSKSCALTGGAVRSFSMYSSIGIRCSSVKNWGHPATYCTNSQDRYTK